MKNTRDPSSNLFVAVTEAILVHVTEAHIKPSWLRRRRIERRPYQQRCPLALALEDETNQPWSIVDQTARPIPPSRTVQARILFDFDEEVQARLDLFDRTGEMRPFMAILKRRHEE